MDNNTKNTIIFSLIALAIISLVLVNLNETQTYNNGLPKIRVSSEVTEINKKLFVDEENAGPMDFDTAEEFCNAKGMRLPTRNEAWEMWLASSNCKMAKVTAKQIIKDKQTFLRSCHKEGPQCTVSAGKVKYSCNPDVDLLFLDEKSYRYGNYWLKDRYDRNGHYTANFINGVTNAYADNIKLLGVRCVKENK